MAGLDYFRWPAPMRNAFLWGCVFGLLVLVTTPTMLARAWRAYHGEHVAGKPWHHWLGSAAANGVLGVGGVYWACRRWQRERARLRVGQCRCPRCGYDLRATPGTCPECGTPATPHA